MTPLEMRMVRRNTVCVLSHWDEDVPYTWIQRSGDGRFEGVILKFDHKERTVRDHIVGTFPTLNEAVQAVRRYEKDAEMAQEIAAAAGAI